ncbi:magnesium/cobalt transporter CorA [Nocardioides sp. BGMRC 2183]|nr:magnesium/cobalt transporter CorA [Nocardioides sp. BGMRC 2183]
MRSVIVDGALYRNGHRVAEAGPSVDVRALREAAVEEGDFIWVGLHEPEHHELAAVAEVFDLHRLAVEDAVKAHQRPKLERYDASLFLVLKTLWYVDADDAVETGEINVFVGSDFVVTVRHGSGSPLRDARRSLESRQAMLDHGPSGVVYGVCDAVVDSYAAVLAGLENDVDEVEAAVFGDRRTDESGRIYTLKREVAEVRRAVLPLREPMHRFATGATSQVVEEAAPFFRDIVDHLARAAEQIDTLEGLLSSAFDGHMARIAAQQNDDMRKISAAIGLAAVPTLIAGVYGMNFDHMPELHWMFGYPFALLLMIATSLGLWWFFKRSGWL